MLVFHFSSRRHFHVIEQELQILKGGLNILSSEYLAPARRPVLYEHYRMLLTAALGWLRTRPYHPTPNQRDKVLTRADKRKKKEKD